MTTPLGHRRARLLLAPYALDALEPDERDAVEQHLAECQLCTAEVDEHREVLAQVVGEGEPPPAAVWDKIAASIAPADAGGQERDTVVPLAPRRKRVGAPPTMVAVAAAIVLLLGLVSVRSVQLQQRLDDIRHSPDRGLTEAANAARRAPNARVFALRHTDGRPVAEAIVLPDGRGYLESNGLSPLANEQGYQLWAMVADTPISVAVLGSRPATSAFRVPPGTAALAVSVERQSGSVAPTSQPVAVGQVPDRE